MDISKWKSCAVDIDSYCIIRAMGKNGFRRPGSMIAKLVDEEVKKIMNSTVDLCQKLGHSVESTKINFSSEEISLAIVTIISSNVAYAVKSQSDQTGREV